MPGDYQVVKIHCGGWERSFNPYLAGEIKVEYDLYMGCPYVEQ
jgi:hypothetical protein